MKTSGNKIMRYLSKNNKCVACGGCCKAIVLGVDIFEGGISDNKKTDLYFCQNNFVKITLGEAMELNPYLLNWNNKKYKLENSFFYKCLNFDYITNKCKIHNSESRTTLCVGYPYYSSKKHFLMKDPTYSKECGYKTFKTLSREDKKRIGGK